MTGGLRSSRAGTAAVATLAIALTAGCGGNDDSDSASKRPGDVPAGSVAVVGDSQITKPELDRRVAALRRSAGGGAPAKGTSKKQPSSAATRQQLQSQALSGLLHEKAIEQEAAERDVTIDPREVSRRWNSAKQAQFTDKRALRRFLGGQTEQDVLRQLRLQMLTEKIHDQIREDDGDAAVERFQADLQKRWTDRTACQPRYAALGCGNRSE